MLDVEIEDGASAALAALPDRLRTALSAKLTALAGELQTRIAQKLSGGVLNQKTGALARSIVTVIDDSATDASVSVSVSGDIKYAAIHEFGGVIPPMKLCRTRRKRWPSSSAASKPSPNASTCQRW